MSDQLIPVPALTAPRKPRKLSSSDTVLDSGLRVLAVRKPGVPLVEFRLRIPFLSARSGHAARAALLSDTMLTATVDHDRAGLAGAVQALGGDVRVGVDADRLALVGNVLASNLGPLLAILRDVLTTASYPADEVETERGRLLENLTISRSRSQVVANEALGHRLFGEHPYSLDLPQPAEVAAVTAGQIRKLHAEFVRPDRAVLVLVGDLSPARVSDQVAQALAPWVGRRPAARSSALPTIVPGPVQLIDRPGSVQSSIRMGAPAIRRDDPGFPALQLANTIFGGYFSSRWTENIREDKGYTYGPHSAVDHKVLGSTLVLDVDVATEVTAPALLETFYELGRIASLPVTEAELASVRQYAIGTLALSTATQAGLASTLSALIGVGLGPEWLVEHPGRLAALTVDEVSAAAAEFFGPTRFVGVIVGDAATIEAPLAAITALAK
jgi:predicted Zn-dependent peptidase